MQFGDRRWSAAEVLERVGRPQQVCGVRNSLLQDGPEAGVRAIDLYNEALSVTVHPERGMDIGALVYKGLRLTWDSGTGVVNPALVDPLAHGWGRGFHGGLAATCGLENVGPACEDLGEPFPQHGTLSYTPARSVTCRQTADDRRFGAEVSGEVAGYGGLLFIRTVRVETGSAVVTIADEVRNPTPRAMPWMIQYHMNFGFPLLSEEAEVLVPGGNPVPRDPESAPGLPTWHLVEEPRKGYHEQVFCHRQAPGARGYARCALVNEPLGLGVAIDYPAAVLPYLWQWRFFAPKRYVMALEPSNCPVKPRSRARDHGALPMLQPHGRVRMVLKVSVVEGPPALKRLRSAMR